MPFADLSFLRQRTFGLVSMTGLTCTLMVTWEGILMSVVSLYLFIRSKLSIRRLTRVFHSAFASGLGNGGPSGLVYGYLFVWAGTVTQVLIMAELGSMYVPSVSRSAAAVCACFSAKILALETGYPSRVVITIGKAYYPTCL